jgi:prepilin-type N-terminal cleavage/methylation domain-containing protein
MKAKQAGFTLIELMFTIVVLAVLLGIGVPNFRDFIRNSRITSAANDLLADFALARSESVKRRVNVSVCSSADPTANNPACDGAAVFSGWIVFVDDINPLVAEASDGDGDRDAGELVLRRRTVPSTIQPNAADGSRVVFSPSGFVDGTVPNQLTQMVLCDSRGNRISVGGLSAARGIRVTPTGRASVTRAIADVTALGGCP